MTGSVYDRAVRASGLTPTHGCLLAQVPGGAIVLELGPASGYLTRVLSERGCMVDAIELDPRDAEAARQYCRKIIAGSAEDPASYSGLSTGYDVALMADVLEHLRRPELALREVRARLSARGLALASLPNVAYWKMRLDLLRGQFQYRDSGLLDRTHLRFFTVKTAIDLFESEGFRVEELVVPPPRVPRLGRAKTWVKSAWPALFALQVVYRLRPV